MSVFPVRTMCTAHFSDRLPLSGADHRSRYTITVRAVSERFFLVFQTQQIRTVGVGEVRQTQTKMHNCSALRRGSTATKNAKSSATPPPTSPKPMNKRNARLCVFECLSCLACHCRWRKKQNFAEDCVGIRAKNQGNDFSFQCLLSHQTHSVEPQYFPRSLSI